MEGKEILGLLDFAKKLQEKGEKIQKSLEEGGMTLDEKVRFRSEANIYQTTAGELRILLEKLVNYHRE